MRRCAAMPGAGTVWNGLRRALAIIRGRIIFNRAMPERLRTLRHCIFTGGVVMVNCICSAAFCESVAQRQSFRLKRKACGRARSPLGELSSVARLRGCKSAEPEKTVKRSSRRTGVNLQFFLV